MKVFEWFRSSTLLRFQLSIDRDILIQISRYSSPSRKTNEHSFIPGSAGKTVPATGSTARAPTAAEQSCRTIVRTFARAVDHRKPLHVTPTELYKTSASLKLRGDGGGGIKLASQAAGATTIADIDRLDKQPVFSNSERVPTRRSLSNRACSIDRWRGKHVQRKMNPIHTRRFV